MHACNARWCCFASMTDANFMKLNISQESVWILYPASALSTRCDVTGVPMAEGAEQAPCGGEGGLDGGQHARL